MSAKCKKCHSPSIRIKDINIGKYKTSEVEIDCTPLISLTCFSCGWCGHIPFSNSYLEVKEFKYDEESTVTPEYEWESLSSFKIISVSN